MANERIIVYGTDITERIEEAKKECGKMFMKAADELIEIDLFMADDKYKDLDFLRLKARERYADLMFDRLTSDIAVDIFEIVARVSTPNTITTEEEYREYKNDIVRRIAKEILKEAKVEE